MKKARFVYVLLAVIVVSSLVLSGCGPAKLGTDKNPITWVFVPSGELESVSAGAESVADLIYQETGLVIKTYVATDYTAAIEAMCSDPPQAQMSSLATFAYIVAADRGCAEAELVSVRRGSTTYTGQIMAAADSGITSLADLKGSTFCAVEPTSTSGWIIPSIMIRAAGVDPDTDMTVTFAGSHPAAVSGIYNGDCDAGASFVDARTTIEEDNPDVMEKVNVIDVSIGIPNDGVQYSPSMPRETRDKINDALLKIAQTDAGKEALGTAYQWDGLEKQGDSFYDQFRQLLDAAGVNAADF